MPHVSCQNNFPKSVAAFFHRFFLLLHILYTPEVGLLSICEQINGRFCVWQFGPSVKRVHPQLKANERNRQRWIIFSLSMIGVNSS